MGHGGWLCKHDQQRAGYPSVPQAQLACCAVLLQLFALLLGQVQCMQCCRPVAHMSCTQMIPMAAVELRCCLSWLASEPPLLSPCIALHSVEGMPDTLLHTAALLSLVRLAGELAQVEASCAGPVDWSNPGPTGSAQSLVPDAPVGQLLCQPHNQPLAVVGRFVRAVVQVKTPPLRSTYGPLVLAPTIAMSPVRQQQSPWLQMAAAWGVELSSIHHHLLRGHERFAQAGIGRHYLAPSTV
jgi:hypothetical protein